MGEDHSDATTSAARILAEFLAEPVRKDEPADSAERAAARLGSLEGLCREHPALARELQSLAVLYTEVEKLGVAGHIGPWGWDGSEDGAGDPDALRTRILKRLAQAAPRERYRVGDELDRGGMGRIHTAFDRELRRELAMKVLIEELPPVPAPGGSQAERSSLRLARFFDEAQITAQLDHPGIVPIHELGMGPDGLFFTMKLVKGETLKRTFERVHAGEPEWTRTRVLGALLKVCEAMTYAHAKGVVHRDLKPGNVMVGRFGEVYVMDWGLARVLDREDRRDIRVRARDILRTDVVRSDRRDLAAESPDSPLFTMEGDVVGTPVYMPPEQAAGNIEEVGPRSDVYAVGAMLYHLLAGHMPYVPPGAKMNNYAVWSRVQAGPPEPLSQVASDAPAELIAICEKAMARAADDRYDDMAELSLDLRAFLENRVVRAHRTGALPELRKWVGRNRGMAVALASVLAVLIGSASIVAYVQHGRLTAERRARDEAAAPALLAALEASWPIHPDAVPDMRAWLEEARPLAARLPDYEAELAALEAKHADAVRVPDRLAVARSPDEYPLAHLQQTRDFWKGEGLEYYEERLRESSSAEERAEIEFDMEVLRREAAGFEARIEALRGAVERHREWRFADAALEARYARLADLVRRVRRIDDPAEGARAVELRAERAASLRAKTIEEYEDTWRDAAQEIAGNPLYAGLQLSPQLGLVPLRRNPGSLWEFWHTLSGEAPEIDDAGNLRIGPDTGLVFVLIPGGRVPIGAQVTDPDAPNYVDANEFVPHDSEQPAVAVELDPYFLSKYELTQAQWERLAGEWPSEWHAGTRPRASRVISQVHPVESVSWDRAQQGLVLWNLTLPTEAQWERAARANTQGWFAWAPPEKLMERMNFADRSAAANGFGGTHPFVDDGHALHSPVDRFPPNPWGLHGMLDNVSEWCLDWFAVDYTDVELAPGSGEITPEYGTRKTMRGGNFKVPLGELRVTIRYGRPPIGLTDELGLRPAMALTLQPDPETP